MSRTKRLRLPSAPPIKVVFKQTEIWEKPWTAEQLGADVRFGVPSHSRAISRVFEGGTYLAALQEVRTPKDALAFLQHYGHPWSYRWTEPRAPRACASYIDLSEIRALQEELKKAARLPLAKWISGLRDDLLAVPSRLDVEHNLEGPRPTGVGEIEGDLLVLLHRASTGAEACASHVFWELLAGVRYGSCVNRDCQKLYKKETDHKRKYCSYACGHLIAQRGYRRTLKGKKRRNPRRSNVNL